MYIVQLYILGKLFQISVIIEDNNDKKHKRVNKRIIFFRMQNEYGKYDLGTNKREKEFETQ